MTSYLRYNFSSAELSACVELISTIKSLAKLLEETEPIVAPWLRMHMHHALQQLAQGNLLKALQRAHKRSRDILTPLLSLRKLIADWEDGKEKSDDYINASRKGSWFASKSKANSSEVPTKLTQSQQ